MGTNLNTTTIVLIMIGSVLIYASVKQMDPRDVMRKAIGKEPKYGFFGEVQGFARPINPVLPGGGGGGGARPTSTIGGLPATTLPFAPSV